MTGRRVLVGLGWVVALGLAVGWRAWGVDCPAEEWAVPGGVAATVDGQQVLWEDVELDVLAAMAQAGVRFEGASGDRQLRELREGMRERAVERVLLEQEARRRGLRADPEKVEEALQKLRAGVPEGTLLDRLVDRGQFAQALRRRAESNVLVDRLVEGLRAQAAPSEEELRAYYREDPDRFREPEAAYFRQVVTADRRTAEEAVRRLRAGERVEEVGERLAPGRPGFEKGAGELRMFRGNPDPREPVLFRLRPGEVGGPVELPAGFAVLRLERRTRARVLPFTEVREQVYKHLAARKFTEALRSLVRDLRDRAEVRRSPVPGIEAPPPSPSPAQGR